MLNFCVFVVKLLISCHAYGVWKLLQWLLKGLGHQIDSTWTYISRSKKGPRHVFIISRCFLCLKRIQMFLAYSSALKMLMAYFCQPSLFWACCKCLTKSGWRFIGNFSLPLAYRLEIFQPMGSNDRCLKKWPKPCWPIRTKKQGKMRLPDATNIIVPLVSLCSTCQREKV